MMMLDSVAVFSSATESAVGGMLIVLESAEPEVIPLSRAEVALLVAVVAVVIVVVVAVVVEVDESSNSSPSPSPSPEVNGDNDTGRGGTNGGVCKCPSAAWVPRP